MLTLTLTLTLTLALTTYYDKAIADGFNPEAAAIAAARQQAFTVWGLGERGALKTPSPAIGPTLNIHEIHTRLDHAQVPNTRHSNARPGLRTPRTPIDRRNSTRRRKQFGLRSRRCGLRNSSTNPNPGPSPSPNPDPYPDPYPDPDPDPDRRRNSTRRSKRRGWRSRRLTLTLTPTLTPTRTLALSPTLTLTLTLTL